VSPRVEGDGLPVDLEESAEARAQRGEAGPPAQVGQPLLLVQLGPEQLGEVQAALRLAGQRQVDEQGERLLVAQEFGAGGDAVQLDFGMT
jgi:hypothetical protein